MTQARRPDQYKGVRAQNPPNIISADRAPTTHDTAYVDGDIWVNFSTPGSWQYAGGGIWMALGGSVNLSTLTGDTGGAIVPVSGNINISGGTNIAIAGSAGQLTPNITGQIPVANGGLGVGTLAAHGVLIGEGTSAVAVTTAGTLGQVLISGGASADPGFGALGVNSGLNGILLGNTNSAATALTYVPATSWTPNLQINGSSTGITYSAQTGYYTQIGSLVIFGFLISLSSKGASTGVVSLSNLPVTVGANSGNFQCNIVFAGVSFTATNSSIRMMPSTGTVGFFSQFGGAETTIATLADTNLANTSILQGTGLYLVA